MRTTPTLLQGIAGVVAVAAGQYHSLALAADGRVWGWGGNGYGQIGNGSTTSRSTPGLLSTIASVSAIAVGANHSLALTSDGVVYAWGQNSYGQLGVGSTTSQTAPTLVPGLSNVIAIAAGANHSLAVTSAGQLYAWGHNAYSQLGDGTTATRTSPVLIAGLTNVVAVSAGNAHSIARVLGGALYAWGNGGNGQLGLGSTTSRTVPTLIAATSASDLAAAGSQTFARRSDGVLVAWGDNSSGQLGDTTTVQRTAPVVVAGPSVVALMEPGDSHTIAITPDGHLWTWGAGSSGQRGDGTTTASRPTPQDVFTIAGTWGATPPPSLSLVPGTYRTPQVVTVTHAMNPVTIRYTTTGVDPTDTDLEVPAGTQLAVDGTRNFRFRAWASGMPPSNVVSATYVLQPLTPTITPASGTFTSAQTVTITSPTATATVRYTLDGTMPTEASTPYAGPFAASTSMTVTARAFQTDWTPSDLAASVLSLRYGTLAAAPVATPGTGVYAPGQAITLSASAGATIRYTLDGTDPTISSAVYGGPLALPLATTVLTARAFQTDWTPSAPGQWTYQVTDDTTPPTITASVSPAGEAPAWHTTPVEVTFTCVDGGSGIASCTSPQNVQRNGAGIEVTGTAVDLAGNPATLVVTLNVDLAAPRITVYSPQDGDYLPVGTSSVTVRGSAVDFGSGVATLTCNGTAGAVTGQTYSCTVPISPGTNTITVAASDVVGFSTTRSVMFIVGEAPAPTSLVVTPARATLTVGQTQLLTVVDQAARLVSGGAWTSSMATVATVVEVGSRWFIEPLSAGQATMTITREGLTSSVDVTVLAAGTALPNGASLWELPSTSATPPKRAQVLPAVPTGDLPLGEQPAFFFIDEGSAWAADTLVQVDPIRIVATTADGRQLWARAFAEGLLKHVAADNYGGLIIVLSSTYSPSWTPQRLRRLDGMTGSTTWEYYSDDGDLSEAAVHPSGTIFLTEEMYHSADTYLDAFDGRTGAVTRWPLPRGHGTSYVNGTLSYSAPDWPRATGPIITADGTVTLLSGRSTTVSYSRCFQASSGLQCFPDETPGTSDIELFRVDLPTGATAPSTTSVTNPLPIGNATPYKLVPAEDGSLLVAHKKSGAIRRLDSTGQLSSSVDLAGGVSSGTALEAEYVVGESFAYALVKSTNGTGSEAHLLRFDPLTLTVFSSQSVIGAPYVNLKYVDSGGSAHVSGQSLGSWFSHDSMLYTNLIAGWNGGAAALAGDSGTAEAMSGSEWAHVHGSSTGGNSIKTYGSPEEGARVELHSAYQESSRLKIEFGGLICPRGPRYVSTRHIRGTIDRVDAFTNNPCPDGTPPVAAYHTHPPVKGFEDQPSGCRTPVVPNDLDTANSHPWLPFYLLAPEPLDGDGGSVGAPGLGTKLYKWWYGEKNARENVYIWRSAQWQPFSCTQ